METFRYEQKVEAWLEQGKEKNDQAIIYCTIIHRSGANRT